MLTTPKSVFANVSGVVTKIVVKSVLTSPNPNQKSAITIQTIGGIESKIEIIGLKKTLIVLKQPAIKPRVMPIIDEIKIQRKTIKCHIYLIFFEI